MYKEIVMTRIVCALLARESQPSTEIGANRQEDRLVDQAARIADKIALRAREPAPRNCNTVAAYREPEPVA